MRIYNRIACPVCNPSPAVFLCYRSYREQRVGQITGVMDEKEFAWTTGK